MEAVDQPALFSAPVSPVLDLFEIRLGKEISTMIVNLGTM
jgi:hypothetical protein